MEGTPPISLSEDETGVKLIIIIIIIIIIIQNHGMLNPYNLITHITITVFFFLNIFQDCIQPFGHEMLS